MIGWASTPYDPYWAQRYPKEAAAMALAGPAANLLLVIVAGILIHIGIAARGFFMPPDSIEFTRVVQAYQDGYPQGLAILVSVLFMLNLLLFVFNLIPVPPLDGTAWMELALKGEARYKYQALMNHPTMRIFGIFIAWYVLDFVFGPVKLFALNALYIWRGITYG